MSKITLDNLSDKLKAYLEGLGLSEEQVLNLINENGLDEEELKVMLKDTMSINELSTNSKTVIGAINELFINANNGKQLIADAIGEPLDSSDTFSAMSGDINSLLSTFKTNMMNNGITVESSDKFKALIDKIATLADSEGKGVQYAEGTSTSIDDYVEYDLLYDVDGHTEYFLEINIEYSFIPTILVATYLTTNKPTTTDNSIIGFSILINNSTQYVLVGEGIAGFKDSYGNGAYVCKFKDYTINDSSIVLPVPPIGVVEYNWFAFGVGEEDTTLRDSLASILTDEGVEVTDEDDMASLITKTDEEFESMSNEINELEDDAESTRNTLADLMLEGGYDITGDEDINSLLELLTISGINVSDIKQISCGAEYTFILKNDGSVWCCGCNYGQLGLGDTDDRTTFTQVNDNINNDVAQIACGYNHTFILKNDGSVWACGWNYYGQLGLGTSDEGSEKTSFTQVTTNINNDVKQISCGAEYTFILKNDGSVYSCGSNYYGQLGLGTSDTNAHSTFTQVTTNIDNDAEQIVCGDYHTFILKNDGSVYSCGYNRNGQLGLGDTTNRTSFTQVNTNINNDVKQIACGENYTFILKNDGIVYSCGENIIGQLGLGDTTNRTSFTQVTTNINNDVKQIACGYNHTFIIKNDGSVYSCGYNDKGQLGLGDTTDRTSFTQVTSTLNDFKQIACGSVHTFILKNDGSVYSCGKNQYGQLGLGASDTNAHSTFTQVTTNIKEF